MWINTAAHDGEPRARWQQQGWELVEVIGAQRCDSGVLSIFNLTALPAFEAAL